MNVRILLGDVRAKLAELPDAGVHCVVTSPPYFGLRDYGMDGQIGLEQTPAEFVAALVGVFREVHRVLRNDGTLWLNLGDSYASAWVCNRRSVIGSGSLPDGKRANRPNRLVDGLKEKDLMGIPWRVAFALQQPYYTGKITDERDRVWLAAMVDAEGSICGTEYETGDRTKTNIYISVTNTSVPIIDKCERLFPQAVKHVYEKAGPSSRICYRWDVERMETKALFIREIYPYLVAKRKQAVVAYTFLELQRGLFSKKKGYLPEQQEQRSWLMATLSKLNAGEDVDLPDWLIEPPSLFEPGFYLRQDIIWSKPNPMPESVTDRCTKAHEYLFLLSKSPRYYFDVEAIAEPLGASSVARLAQNVAGQTGSDRVPGKTNGTMKAVGKLRASDSTNQSFVPGASPHGGLHRAGTPRSGGRRAAGNKTHKGLTAYEAGDDRLRTKAGLVSFAERERAKVEAGDLEGTRNRRSVWTVATQPFKEAHFATFPPDLVEPCILAGCPKGGTVLDPFGGAGTTGLVADRLGRNAILIELNPEYAAIAERRIKGDAGMFAEVKSIAAVA